MKILMVNEYSSVKGGTDVVVDNQAKELIKAGIEVKLIRFSNKKFYSLKYFKRSLHYSISFLKNAYSNYFNQEINDFKPDIIHFHNVYQMFRSPLWNYCKPGKAKLVIQLHNFYPFCLNSRLFNKENCHSCFENDSWLPGIIKKCYNNSLFKSILVSANRISPQKWISCLNKISIVIAVSKFHYRRLIEFGIPENLIKILPNSVQIQNKSEKGRYVLYLGNIVKHKGIEMFCRAAENIPKIPFIAAGGGDDLFSISERFKRVSNLKFVGYVEGNHKEELLRGCRFLYFPSQCPETFGLSILEAFSYGKPVLTSGYGATAELVINRITGIIDESFDSQLSSVVNLWNELETKNEYPVNCIEASKNYSIEKHITKLLNIYRSVL